MISKDSHPRGDEEDSYEEDIEDPAPHLLTHKLKNIAKDTKRNEQFNRTIVSNYELDKTISAVSGATFNIPANF